MKTEKLDETRLEEIIVTFANYVKAYYEEGSDPDDVPDIVNECLKDFIDWAYDDFAINKEERESLKHSTDLELQKEIMRSVEKKFLSMLEESALPET